MQDVFENPVTNEMDIIETALLGQAKVYNSIDELKIDFAKLGLNHKFFNTAGNLLLTVQALPPSRT